MITSAFPFLDQNRFGLVILGDRGYTGEALFDDMRKKGSFQN